MAPSTPYSSARPPRRGFTLLELLTVMAVIGILAGILVPVLGAVQRHTKKARNLVLFSKVANAIQEYQLKYDRYPIFAEMDAQANGDDFTFLINAGDNYLLRVLALTGDTSDPARDHNRSGIPFLSLPDVNFSPDSPGGSIQNPKLIDAFNNDQIAVIVHTGRKRQISRDSFTIPVASSDGTKPLIPIMMKEFLPQSIAIYSMIENKRDDAAQSDFSTNWPYHDYDRP